MHEGAGRCDAGRIDSHLVKLLLDAGSSATTLDDLRFGVAMRHPCVFR
jgi:hypothetical protein